MEELHLLKGEVLLLDEDARSDKTTRPCEKALKLSKSAS